jgi:hypothetical protein
MKQARQIYISTLVGLLMLHSLTGPLTAGTIDTLPPNGSLATAGSLAQGGTFVADDEFLAEFTIQFNWGDARSARPIVLGTTPSGEPTLGPILWEGADVTTPFNGLMTFTPSLPLTIGERYFIGLDYGFFTSVDGDIILVGSRSDDPIPDGHAWRILAGSWNAFSSGVDIAARIVMTDMPLVAVEETTFSHIKALFR